MSEHERKPHFIKEMRNSKHNSSPYFSALTGKENIRDFRPTHWEFVENLQILNIFKFTIIKITLPLFPSKNIFPHKAKKQKMYCLGTS